MYMLLLTMSSSKAMHLQAGIQNAATASAAIGAVNVIGTIIAGSLIEKAGRVQLLTVSFGGMCLSMFAMVAGRTIPALASSAGDSCSPAPLATPSFQPGCPDA